MDTLRLDRVELENYRCFSTCQVDLDPQLTVFVAENAHGKTAILDAISTALEPIVDDLTGDPRFSGITPGDVRIERSESTMLPRLPANVRASGILDGNRRNWRIERNSVEPRRRTFLRDASALLESVAGLRARLDRYARSERDLAPPLPLIAYYGTGRLWAEERLTEGRRRRDSTIIARLAGYRDCLTSNSAFKSFVAWYGATFRALQGGTAVASTPGVHPLHLLNAVRQTTRRVLEPTGWSVLDWDTESNAVATGRGNGCIVVEHESGGRQPLSRLSDGVRNMVAFVADAAHRCARLNPQFGEDAPQLTPGILMVDEIDMHLHPSWQQQIVELIQHAFPKVQLILTTHSPQVLSTVDSDSIRLISIDQAGHGKTTIPEHQTRGVESADVLAAIMGVDPIPRVSQSLDLARYRMLIETGDHESDDGKQLRAGLVDHFGPKHPLMLDCDRLIRFSEFKRSKLGGST